MSQPAIRPDDVSQRMAEEHRQAQIARNQTLIALLNAWEKEDPQEQRETLDLLIHALDEDRPSSRKLFAE